MASFDPDVPCRKCGWTERLAIRYQSEIDALELTCGRCGYQQAVRPLDYQQPTPAIKKRGRPRKSA